MTSPIFRSDHRQITRQCQLSARIISQTEGAASSICLFPHSRRTGFAPYSGLGFYETARGDQSTTRFSRPRYIIVNRLARSPGPGLSPQTTDRAALSSAPVTSTRPAISLAAPSRSWPEEKARMEQGETRRLHTADLPLSRIEYRGHGWGARGWSSCRGGGERGSDR
ncbi:hypothetical protein EJ06DRAFT_533617 [Trichodelitschia bisporula]|uniref:Uncharacterized protein n=1 Tax=Trichodelitschia bisporula TaxID=703511 RepID=A0A6G1HLW1_9PEZI|nr:hypothetical protein EJ06DRAFT_533617 [Trichodelitschia bisporula]